VRSGKVLHIGASNYKAWHLAKALKCQALNGWTPFASMQVQYNLVYREEEREMIPLCVDEGIGVTAWSAMARGFLAGNRTTDGQGQTARAKADEMAKRLYFRDSDFVVQKQLASVADARGVPPMQIALAWIKGRRGLTAPIVGVTKIAQLEQAIEALDIELSPQERDMLESSYETRRPAFE